MEQFAQPKFKRILVRRMERWSKVISVGGFLMLDLLTSLSLGEGHIEGQACNDCVPGFVLGDSTTFDRTPKINDLFFGHTFKKVLVPIFIES
jgi:hypothetical protein